MRTCAVVSCVGGHHFLAVHLLQVLLFSVFLWLQMRNRRFPSGWGGGGGCGGGQTEARTDPQLMKEKSQSRGIKRLADDKANEITQTEKHARSQHRTTHTHTHTFNLSAWVCNHTFTWLLRVPCMWHRLRNCTVFFTNGTLPPQKTTRRLLHHASSSARPGRPTNGSCAPPSLRLRRWTFLGGSEP